MKKYDIVLESWGSTRKVLIQDISLEEALQFCEEHDWIWDTGYIWDLDIEEREEDE